MVGNKVLPEEKKKVAFLRKSASISRAVAAKKKAQVGDETEIKEIFAKQLIHEVAKEKGDNGLDIIVEALELGVEQARAFKEAAAPMFENLKLSYQQQTIANKMLEMKDYAVSQVSQIFNLAKRVRSRNFTAIAPVTEAREFELKDPAFFANAVYNSLKKAQTR